MSPEFRFLRETAHCAAILLLLFISPIQGLRAESRAVQTRLESRLEENLQTIRLEYLCPGLRCMLIGRGEAPRAMKPIVALQWQFMGAGPLVPCGILKEVQKPFEYAASSPIFQQTAGYRINFSLNPQKRFGGVLLGRGEHGRSAVWVETDDCLQRAGGWFDTSSFELIQLTVGMYTSLLPERSRETAEEGALQSRYPDGVHVGRFTTVVLQLEVSEDENCCSLLSALMWSPVGEAALFGRAYMRFGRGGCNNGVRRCNRGYRGRGVHWECILLGRVIGQSFTTARGEIPEEKASLQGILTVGIGRSGICMEGAVERDKPASVPERFIACERKSSVELYCGFLCFDCSVLYDQDWGYDEVGELKADCSFEAEVEAVGEHWKVVATTSSKRSEGANPECKQRFKYQVDPGRWRLSGSCDLQDSMWLQSGYIRCEREGEYQGDELCLWVKLAWEFDKAGRLETPLSLGVKLEHSEMQ